jgi:hypothetical protein
VNGGPALAPTGTSAAAPAPGRDHYALVIGIQNYREFERLAAPHRDATRFCQWLTDVINVPRENIQLVLGGDRDGTPANGDILNALDNLGLRLRLRKGSRLYIYYAGHGIGSQINEVALLPADARINALHQQVFGASQIIDHLFKTRYFDELIMFLDCCREAQEVATLGLPYRPLEPVPDSGAKPPPRYCVLVGSNMDGRSFEVERGAQPGQNAEDYRGLMTEALLEGLNGATGAIDPQLNAVTTASLERFLRLRVAELAKAATVPQQAGALLSTADPIVLLQYPSVRQITLRVTPGAQHADKTFRIRNLRSKEWRLLGIAQAGKPFPDMRLDIDTRHLLTDGGDITEILDPATMSDPHVLTLE